MWGTIGAFVLVTFLLIGSAVVVGAFIRGVRSKGFPDITRGEGAEAYLRAVAGPQPHTPLPEWAVWDEDTDGDEPEDKTS